MKYLKFINESNDKFEVGDICFLKIGSGNNPLYWKVMITGKGREADEFGPASNHGYRYKNLEYNGQGWSSRVDAFVKEKPEPKRIFSPEDPYGEEDWDDDILENLNIDSNEEKLTTVQLWNLNLRKGRKYILNKLRNREIEFIADSNKVKKYSGTICGYVPAFINSTKKIIVLFDTIEYGTLKVNDKYPIILKHFDEESENEVD